MIKVEVFGAENSLAVEICRLLKKAAKVLKEDNFQIDIYLIKEKEMLKLNRKFRGEDKSTTVLSFPPSTKFIYPPRNLPYKGEIFLNFSSIRKEAKIYNIPLKDYAMKILIHGFLHLMGFGHNNKRSQAIMGKKEKEILTKLGAK